MSTSVEIPFAQPIRPAKQGARRHYGSHPYFTKRAWNVVQGYIEHFSSPGDTVLDPFGGSGVTAVESLVLRRKAIYVDISEWACFLARQTAIAPVDIAALQEAFGQVEDDCRADLEKLNAASVKELAERPVKDWYPRDVPLPKSADGQRVEDLFTPRMLHGLARLRAAIVKVGDRAVRDLLLLAFSSTLARINRTFISTKNRRESRGGSAIFSIYRYKVAKNAVELPLWDQYVQRFRRLVDAKRETNRLIGKFYQEGDTAIFRQGSATRLDDWLEAGSVDYIYTDPPYGGHIAYLDLSTMWAAWLGFSIRATDRADEVIEGGELKKTRDDYQQQLSLALQQMHEALKSGKWLSIVFAHRDTAYWESLVDACRKAGFAYVNTVVQPVGVVWSMHKKKNPLRVLSGELVLNFRKAARVVAINGRLAKTDALSVVTDCCQREIITCCGASTEDLHHAVVPRLLETGLLTRFSKEWGDLTPLLEHAFEFDRATGKWHLRHGADVPPKVPRRALIRYAVLRHLEACTRAGRTTSAEKTASYVRSILDSKKTDSALIRSVLAEVGFSADNGIWKPAGKPRAPELSLF
jgi:16S rRNA G966 N2-methylase RsmD